MSDHRLNAIEHRLLRLEKRLAAVADALANFFDEIHQPWDYDEDDSPPAAPILAGFFTFSGDSMNAVLIATIPTTRTDGSALAPTAIASITFQKTSLVGTPPAAGPQQPLQVNKAVAGAGLALADLSFTDTSSLVGDSYTCFVTDTNGDAGALSNAVVNTVVAKPSAPSAPTLAATFS